jgi:hypothetical protein
MSGIALLRSGPHDYLLERRLSAHGKLESILLLINLLSEQLGVVPLERDLGLDRLHPLQ